MSISSQTAVSQTTYQKLLMDVDVKPIIKTKPKFAIDISKYRPVLIATAALELL